jgi:hypothetical protein
VVLIHESPADGWWEATVEARDLEILTLRFRDYPRQPKLQRHISSRLVRSGPNSSRLFVGLSVGIFFFNIAGND